MAIEVTSRSLFKGRPDKSALYKEIQPNPSVARRKSISRFQSARVVTRLMRRNFSSRAPELSGGQAIILSIPKSGRTWIRTFLCAYFCKRYAREFTLEPERYGEPGIPRLIFSHDCFEHRTKGDLWDRIRGKYLVPKRELRRAKIILLVRDPRDCFQNPSTWRCARSRVIQSAAGKDWRLSRISFGGRSRICGRRFDQARFS